MRDNAIGPEKPKELSKSPWKCKVKKRAKESKWARDTQEKTNGTQEPASDVIKEPMVVLGHWKKNITAGPKRPNMIEANNFVVGMIEWYGRRW